MPPFRPISPIQPARLRDEPPTKPAPVLPMPEPPSDPPRKKSGYHPSNPWESPMKNGLVVEPSDELEPTYASGWDELRELKRRQREQSIMREDG